MEKWILWGYLNLLYIVIHPYIKYMYQISQCPIPPHFNPTQLTWTSCACTLKSRWSYGIGENHQINMWINMAYTHSYNGKICMHQCPCSQNHTKMEIFLDQKIFLELPYIKQFLSNKIINWKSTNTIYILTVQINYVPKTRIVLKKINI